jgi:predicted ribosome quality control (RQC) complex YloA/Tae2 family protein
MHTKDIHGSHAILQLNSNELPDNNILVKCAEIVAYHSKAKNSSNVPVDICEVKYVKKPNGAKPGMVIYSNNKTLYVEPKKS